MGPAIDRTIGGIIGDPAAIDDIVATAGGFGAKKTTTTTSRIRQTHWNTYATHDERPL